MKRHPTPIASLLVGALALLTLSGCAGLHAGTAATVGDETIPSSEVDDVTRISCELGGSAPQPRSAVMRDIVNAMVTTRVDTQYAESVGATYDKSQLQQRVQQLEDSLRLQIVSLYRPPQPGTTRHRSSSRLLPRS